MLQNLTIILKKRYPIWKNGGQISNNIGSRQCKERKDQEYVIIYRGEKDPEEFSGDKEEMTDN